MKLRLTALCLLVLLLLSTGHALADPVYESNMLLVNKEFGLPKDYVPSDLVVANVAFSQGVAESKKQMRADAAHALEDMFSAALKDGIELLGISGYRSYYTQRDIYNRRLKEMGEKHVAKYNAEPGHSEHQTGLAMDVGCPGCTDLSERFARTDAYLWMQQNAHLYGFIIRYPKGGEDETGYAFEPWHLRYVGSEAPAIRNSGMTLESYYAYKLRSTAPSACLPRLYSVAE